MNKKNKTLEIHDFVVIGSGAAGLTFALEASRSGSVLILTKDNIKESNTRYAQGGIAAVLNIEDDYSKHISDTIKAGAGLCNEEAVRVLVLEAPARIRDLLYAGVPFDASPIDGLQFSREGGHSQHRVLHVGDLTGKAIEEALVNRALSSPNVSILEHVFGVELLVENGICYGVALLDQEGQLRKLISKATVLASGGAGQLYSHTTNPDIATGDGFAMAYRAGAQLSHMEFIQFHPTALSKEGAPTFLISEALRGEGAILLDLNGHRIMEGVHPLADLAPRDIVARTIYLEMIKNGWDHVNLTIAHKNPDWIRQRFPHIHTKCLEYGVDITREPIPVAPAAHYCCGGVTTNIDGLTSITGLYACGEVSESGVHGANRLASNSLLESVVFAYRAAVHGDRYIRYLSPAWMDSAQKIDNESMDFGKGQSKPDSKNVLKLRKSLQALMWESAGIVRTDEGLEKGYQRIREMEREVERLFCNSELTPSIVELRNLIAVGKLVLFYAKTRTRNVGTHYNANHHFPT